jgi:hypothetical protein
MGATSQFEMQRALAGADFKDAPPALDLQPIEQRVRHRIPQLRLRPQARGLPLRVT